MIKNNWLYICVCVITSLHYQIIKRSEKIKRGVGETRGRRQIKLREDKPNVFSSANRSNTMSSVHASSKQSCNGIVEIV